MPVENQFTLTEFKNAVAATIVASKLASSSYEATYAATSGLLNQIGRVFHIEGEYVDRLPEFDGDYLALGTTIEEWFSRLTAAYDYTRTPESCNPPRVNAFNQPYFSYKTDRKMFPVTRYYEDFKEEATSDGVKAALVASVLLAMFNSIKVYEYGLKRELLGAFAERAYEAYQTTNAVADATTAVGTAYTEGTYFKNTATGDIYVVLNTLATTATITTALAAGDIVKLNLVTELAIPTDEISGEAFIKSLKDVVEIVSDENEGNCLSGVYAGVAPRGDLKLYTCQGLESVIDVDTMAGAFNQNKLSPGLEIKSLPDFGEKADSNIWAIMVDVRGVKLHPSYISSRMQECGEGDYVSHWEHRRWTAFFSTVTTIHVWVAA